MGRNGSPKRDRIPNDMISPSATLTPYKMQPTDEAYPKKYQLKISIFKHIKSTPVDAILDAPTSLNREL